MPFWNKKGKSSSSGVVPATLREQYPTPASSETKIRLSILATALIDALGAPAEFQKRFSFPFIDSMLPNTNFKKLNLGPGVWTDDTSMTLCLAISLATMKEAGEISRSRGLGGFDEVDQLQRYRRWHLNGYLSAIDKCFDIDDQTKTALQIFKRYEADTEEALYHIRSHLGGKEKAGNGSLMRIIPIGLAYWHDKSLAKLYAQRSSQATHPSPICLEACEMWTGAIVRIMQEATQPRKNRSDSDDERFSKLSLLEYISNYPYADNDLRQSLTVPFGKFPVSADKEKWYNENHPLLRLINETQTAAAVATRPEPSFPYNIPTAEELPSTAFVLHSLVAALYCFFTTKTFEDGALMAVNLGYDADTVGAIYAGLAACWYSAEEGKAEGIFWTKRVREWRNALVKRELVEQVAENLVVWERKVAEQYK